MKKLAALLLSAALLAGSAAAVAPEEAFPQVNTYPGYADVEGGSWYAAPARVCYEVGLMTGTNTGFTPFGVLTVGEVAAIAARMNEAITGDPIPMATPKPGETLPWYFSYVKYLEDLGIDVPDPTKQATRQEFVSILAAVVPEEMLAPINTITTLPDTQDEAVLRFYNAGILTGADAVPFAGYCQAYARWKEAEQEVTKLGMVYRDGDRVRPNPYIAIARAAFAEVKSLAAEFGLTPANRTAIIAGALTVEKTKKELDPMEQILTSTNLDDVIIVEESHADEKEN